LISDKKVGVARVQVRPFPFVLAVGITIAFPTSMPEEAKESSNDQPRSRSRRLLLVTPVVILAVVGIWFWASQRNEDGGTGSSETRVKSTLHLETFILNLADPDQRAYLRVGIDLGLNHEMKRDETAPVSQIRDTILGVLADAHVDDLMTVAGKNKLKDDVLHALQQKLPHFGVEEVYFTEFLIQR
jgi:flagellar basal body-associated protein FliL